MYRAKASGRGNIELFDRTMRDEAVARLQLERDLRLAVERRELVLEYQPIVDTQDLQPVALEALIRWNHPGRGRLPPDAFIPLAEETGPDPPDRRLGDRDSLRASSPTGRRRDLSEPLLQVAVNVSPVQLADSGFVDRVATLLDRSAIAPGSLCLEITESRAARRRGSRRGPRRSARAGRSGSCWTTSAPATRRSPTSLAFQSTR